MTRSYICRRLTTYTEQQLQLFKESLEGNLKNHVADTNRLRVNIQGVEGQCLSTSEVLENLKQDHKAKKSQQVKKRKIDFSETSDETQQHSQKLRKDKDIKRCKKYRRFWEEAFSTQNNMCKQFEVYPKKANC